MSKAKKASVYQAHDKFFKLTFADKGVKESFLQTYLPEKLSKEIDLSTVEEINPSFISESFQLKESDLLIKVQAIGKPIYVLFLMEHKSYKDRKTPFQILRYFVDIWESQLAKKEKLTPILPIVIYEGKSKWNYPQMREYFKDLPDEWKAYLPLYETLFFDFSLENKVQKLPESIELKSYLQVIQSVYLEDRGTFLEQLIEILYLINQAAGEDSAAFISIFRRILIYTENTRNDLKEEKEDLFDLLKGVDSMSKTSIERWEERIRAEAIDTARDDLLAEGMEKGRAEGRAEGRESATQSIAQKMKRMGFTLDDIQKVTGLML